MFSSASIPATPVPFSLDAGIGANIDLTEIREGLRDYEPLSHTMPGGRSIQRLHAPFQDVGIADPLHMHRSIAA